MREPQTTHTVRGLFDPSDQSRSYFVDGIDLGLEPIDPSYRDLFRPVEILSVVDMKGITVLIVEGNDSRCGSRYEMVMFDIPRGRAGSAYFGHRGTQYDFSSDGRRIWGTQRNNLDPEVVLIDEDLRIYEPTRVFALQTPSIPHPLPSAPVTPQPPRTESTVPAARTPSRPIPAPSGSMNRPGFSGDVRV